MGRIERSFQERRERGDCQTSSTQGLSNDPLLCSKSKEVLRVTTGLSVEVCKRSLKVITGKSKVMLLGKGGRIIM